MATLLSWLDDVLPGRSERVMPPEFSSPEAQEALRSWPGRFLLSWLAVRDMGISYDDVSLLAFPDQNNPEDVERADLEHVRLLDVLFGSRRTATRAEGEKRDISTTWCSEGMASLAREIGVEAMGKLSLDQFEWLMSGGEVDIDARPAHAAEAAADKGKIDDLLEQAKQRRDYVDPRVIEALERAQAAYAATGELPTDEAVVASQEPQS